MSVNISAAPNDILEVIEALKSRDLSFEDNAPLEIDNVTSCISLHNIVTMRPGKPVPPFTAHAYADYLQNDSSYVYMSEKRWALSYTDGMGNPLVPLNSAGEVVENELELARKYLAMVKEFKLYEAMRG